MDTVLGVAITRISAGLVLLEGRRPDEVTVDRDAIDLTGAHASMKDVMAAVLGIQGSLSANGDRLRAVGVTWSDGSEPKARELVTTLTEFGLANIVPVRPAEATSTLAGNLQGDAADTTAPAVGNGEADAVVDGDVPLARGAALALARHATADTEQDKHPRPGRRRPDPGSIAAATVLCGGALGVLAAMWIGVAPRHADSNVPAPVPQQGSAPPPLEVPPSSREVPSPVTEAPQAAASVNTPPPAASHQLVPLGVQHLPASPSPATPPPEGQEPGADDLQNPLQGPPAVDQPVLRGPEPGPPAAEPAPPGAGPAPDNQGAGPADGTAH